MIPTESLAIGSALRWIALALCSVFVFAVVLIIAGEAIFRRLQRKAIERSLNKVEWHKLVGAILLTFLLPTTFTAQLAYAGQTTQTPPAVKSAVQYQKLFAVTSGIMVQFPKVCKTDECGSLATEGAALIADAQTKHQKGLLVDAERATFHDNLDSVLTRTIAAIRANRNATTTAKVKLPDGLTCPAVGVLVERTQSKTKSVVFDQDRCDLCYEVFEQLAEICALYTIVSPDAALICLASATLQFGHCLKEFCGGA
jgi:hypothetical protein